MTIDLERQVRERAKHRCEYCGLPESAVRLKHVVDHIRARQHGGETEPENLALCCGRCNLHKGPNIAGIDPETQLIERLFNPRQDIWAEHFRYDEAFIFGTTAIGRTTVAVLAMNAPTRRAARRALRRRGIEFDPTRL